MSTKINNIVNKKGAQKMNKAVNKEEAEKIKEFRETYLTPLENILSNFSQLGKDYKVKHNEVNLLLEYVKKLRTEILIREDVLKRIIELPTKYELLEETERDDLTKKHEIMMEELKKIQDEIENKTNHNFDSITKVDKDLTKLINEKEENTGRL